MVMDINELVVYYESIKRIDSKKMIKINSGERVYYHPLINRLIKEFSSSNLVDFDYIDNMRRNSWFNYDVLINDIDNMNINNILTCLTFFIKQERYNYGLIKECINKGILIRLLKRSKDILDPSSIYY